MNEHDLEHENPIGDERDDGANAVSRPLTRRKLLSSAGKVAVASAALSAPASLAKAADAALAGSVARRGGHLVEGYPSDIRTMNPWSAVESASYIVTRAQLEGLISLDAAGTPLPALASAVPQPDMNNTIVVRLRPGLKWSDGKPLTADDVVFTYKVLIDPAYSDFSYPDRATVTGALASVRKKDDLTVILQLKSPNASFVSSYCFQGILPKHILGHLTGSQLNTTSYFSGPSVTSGPFKFGRWQQGQQVTLLRNPHYREPTLLDGYTFRVLSGADSVGTALTTGEVDVGNIDLSQLSQLKSSSLISLHPYPSGQVWEVWYQLDPSRPSYKIFGDPAVREALRQAVDIKGIISAVFNGNGSVANSPFSPTTWAYDPKIGQNLKYNDPAGAAALLDKARWTMGSNGVRSKNGVPLQFGLLIANINTLYSGIAQILQQEWRKIGVIANVNTVEIATYANLVISQHNFDAAVAPPGSTGDPDNWAIWWESANASPGGLDTTTYRNPGVDRAIASARHLYSPKLRKTLYVDVQRQIMKDMPAAPLVYGIAEGGINKRVRGFQWNAVAASGIRPWWSKVWLASGR